MKQSSFSQNHVGFDRKIGSVVNVFSTSAEASTCRKGHEDTNLYLSNLGHILLNTGRTVVFQFPCHGGYKRKMTSHQPAVHAQGFLLYRNLSLYWPCWPSCKPWSLSFIPRWPHSSTVTHSSIFYC